MDTENGSLLMKKAITTLSPTLASVTIIMDGVMAIKALINVMALIIRG
jgi:hypothetical protein